MQHTTSRILDNLDIISLIHVDQVTVQVVLLFFLLFPKEPEN